MTRNKIWSLRPGDMVLVRRTSGKEQAAEVRCRAGDRVWVTFYEDNKLKQKACMPKDILGILGGLG